MSTEIVKQQHHVQSFNYFDPEQFQIMQRICSVFASSELVPDMYRASDKNPKEKAIANCMIAVETATRIGASPLMVMQNMYIVHGKPSWSAKFLTATVNACGRFKSIKYKMTLLGKIRNVSEELDNWECIAYTSEKGSDEILESIPVTIEMAVKEGWYNKNGSKWKTMPKLMLQYRSVTYWTSAYAPELSMGIKTEEEVLDIEDVPYEEVRNVDQKVKSEISANANKTELSIDTDEAGNIQQQESAPVNNSESNPNGLFQQFDQAGHQQAAPTTKRAF